MTYCRVRTYYDYVKADSDACTAKVQQSQSRSFAYAKVTLEKMDLIHCENHHHHHPVWQNSQDTSTHQRGSRTVDYSEIGLVAFVVNDYPEC